MKMGEIYKLYFLDRDFIFMVGENRNHQFCLRSTFEHETEASSPIQFLNKDLLFKLVQDNKSK